MDRNLEKVAFNINMNFLRRLYGRLARGVQSTLRRGGVQSVAGKATTSTTGKAVQEAGKKQHWLWRLLTKPEPFEEGSWKNLAAMFFIPRPHLVFLHPGYYLKFLFPVKDIANWSRVLVKGEKALTPELIKSLKGKTPRYARLTAAKKLIFPTAITGASGYFGLYEPYKRWRSGKGGLAENIAEGMTKQVLGIEDSLWLPMFVKDEHTPSGFVVKHTKPIFKKLDELLGTGKKNTVSQFIPKNYATLYQKSPIVYNRTGMPMNMYNPYYNYYNIKGGV